MKGTTREIMQNNVEPCCSKNKLTLYALQSSIRGKEECALCLPATNLVGWFSIIQMLSKGTFDFGFESFLVLDSTSHLM
jgi:hypothetical protein